MKNLLMGFGIGWVIGVIPGLVAGSLTNMTIIPSSWNSQLTNMTIIPSSWKYRTVDPATNHGERDRARLWWVIVALYALAPMRMMWEWIIEFWPVPVGLLVAGAIGFFLGRLTV